MQVIGLTGFAGSGKSTVANYLVEAHGFTRLSFAAPLKKMLRTLDPLIGTIDVEHAEEPWDGWNWTPAFTEIQQITLSDAIDKLGFAELEIKETFPEYRRLLQVLGTDCIRAVDEDFWVKAAVKQMTDPEGKYVFDDVRFPNEAEVIKQLSPYGLWNVGRNALHTGEHPSEKHAGKMGEQVWLWNVIGDLPLLHDQINHEVEWAFEGVTA